MELEDYELCKAYAERARTSVSEALNIPHEQRQFINECLSNRVLAALQDYRYHRLYKIAQLAAPKYRKDLDEDQKPLRLLKLRWWHDSFHTFAYEDVPGGWEIQLMRWAGDEQEHESFIVRPEYVNLPWDQCRAEFEKYMRAQWDSEASRKRDQSIAQAEVDLKNAQERLNRLRAGN